MNRRLRKIICNNEVVHAITETGLVFSWGNDIYHKGTLGLGENIYQVNTPILNKYLRHLGIIKEDEIILFNTFEEELVDMNELINDIYNKDTKDKDILLNETNQKVNNIIDDIFNYVLVK